MAFANEHITAYAVEATQFPDLARKYRITGVPKTVVNDQIEILGGIPQDDFIQQALRAPEEKPRSLRLSRFSLRCSAALQVRRLGRPKGLHYVDVKKL